MVLTTNNHHIPWFLRPVLCHLPPDFHLHRQVGALLERGHLGDVEGAKGKQLDTVNFIWLVVTWWFGTFFIFPYILGISSSQLTFIFFRGVGIPPTSYGLGIRTSTSLLG